jgi:plasmid stabilization system protein ParE
MPFEVKWTDIAIKDVENWVEWIKKDSEIQVGRVASAVFALADDIPRHPLTGHIVPELKIDSIRFKIIYGRRMIYEIRPGFIVIKRIISCRMDFVREYNRGDPGLA